MKTQTVEATAIHFTGPEPEPANVPAVQHEAQPLAPAEPTTILNIIDRASRDPSVDIDKLDRLLAMQERVKADQARREFDNAMADAQEDMKAIRADLYNKQTQSNYASFAALDKAIRPIYSKHGFSLSFDTGDGAPEACVRIVCIVAHRGGHREHRKIDMPADGKGAKGGDVMTRTHATGAATSYGQRYLFKLIFNLAVGDVDDDGNGAGGMGDDSDVEALAPKDAPRDANGKLLSQYNADRANKARDWADRAIECINLSNAMSAKVWRDEQSKVPQGKRKSPLDWLRDNSPGQFLRVRQAYQNATGEDLE